MRKVIGAPPRFPTRPTRGARLAAGEQLDLRQGREIGFDELVEDGRLLGMFAPRGLDEARPLRAMRGSGNLPFDGDDENFVLVAKPETKAELVLGPDALGPIGKPPFLQEAERLRHGRGRAPQEQDAGVGGDRTELGSPAIASGDMVG